MVDTQRIYRDAYASTGTTFEARAEAVAEFAGEV
jgi:hypothetical protein